MGTPIPNKQTNKQTNGLLTSIDDHMTQSHTIGDNDYKHQPNIILLMALGTVFALLASRSISTGLCWDELLYLRAIELGPSDGLMCVGSSHPPLGRLLAGAVISADHPDWFLRLPSVVAALTTVVIWFHILLRVFDDRRTVFVLLPIMILGRNWLDFGFQLLPYSFVTLFASLHCLAWLRLLEKSTWDRIAFFTVSGVAPVWTHFYGLNLLVADQIVWGLLIYRDRSLWKLWLKTTIPCAILTAPVIPVLLFYLDSENGHALMRIAHYPTYLWRATNRYFGRMTFNVPINLPMILLWYVAVAAIVWRWVATTTPSVVLDHEEYMSSDSKANGISSSAIVFVGLFLSGLPATQLHSILSGEAMWERYAVFATWVHWPLMVLFVQRFLGRRWAGLVSEGAFAFCWIGFVVIVGLRQYWTYDHQPVIRCMAENAKPGDVFLAQDFDIFQGDSNYCRLWFQRYAPVDMEIVSAEPTIRFDLEENGLPIQRLDSSINRVWLFSDMYTFTRAKIQQSDDWRIVAELSHAGTPLALVERNQRNE